LANDIREAQLALRTKALVFTTFQFFDLTGFPYRSPQRETSLSPTRLGSSKSKSGSPVSNAKSSPAPSFLLFPIWHANSVATSELILPMQSHSSGSTQIQLATSVTFSLRQATRHSCRQLVDFKHEQILMTDTKYREINFDKSM